MIRLLLLFLLFVPLSCSNPKTVLICGDHVCVNKNEAKLYFEDNLTLEVKIINKKQKKSVDLVQLNLKENTEKKSINIIQKKKTNQPIKVLSNKEIQIIKKDIKDKKKVKRITLKKKKKKKKKLKVTPGKTKTESLTKIPKKIINNKMNSVDICTILEECSIDQISNYLIKMGKNKRFPDITVRE